MTTTTTTEQTPELSGSRPRSRSRAREAWLYRMGSVLLGVALLAAWETLPRSGLVSPLVLPPVTDAAESLWSMLQTSSFWHHFRVSMSEILLGFVIGTVIGLVGGGLLAMSEPIKRLTYGYVVTFQAIPKIVLAPVFITWFGYGQTSKVVMAVTIAFFPVLLNTMVGLMSTPPESVRLMRSLRATRWHLFRHVKLPYALPLISAGVKTALTFAVIGAIVGEFVGAREGLGFLVDSYNFQLRTDAVFAVIIVLAAVGAALYFAVEWIDRRLIHWEDR